eukprot:CAMPEP_0113905692 /NCGR_PEP_ID=MMETSP0780_2-20120614/24206_1 /TAXON_ID=652834 /ORGANISM="Palpitomonas bilix" /LENGTH=283 /DNA_ID=CAMNT_0000899955 /DNA_START=154 /DNA_END=1002 /DNA_ORIENTATION=- /assembly_acc=CAM_ASM_000599
MIKSCRGIIGGGTVSASHADPATTIEFLTESGEIVSSTLCLHTPRRGAVTVKLGNNAYVICGTGAESEDLSSIERFDCSTLTIEEGRRWEFPCALTCACSCQLDSGSMVMGGYKAVNQDCLASIYMVQGEEFDISVRAAGQLLIPRKNATAETLIDGSVIVVGGWDGRSTLRQTELVNVREDGKFRGSLSRPLLEPRECVSSTSVENCVLVFGGFDGFGVTDSAEMLDVRTKTWQMIPRFPGAKRECTSCVQLSSTRFAVIGGWDGYHSLDEVMIYDQTAAKW